MTAPAQTPEQGRTVTGWRPAFMRSAPLRIAVVVICALWSIPTLGLLVTSVRNPVDITTTGWWTALLHPFAGEPVDAGELPARHRAARGSSRPSSTASS